MDRVRLVSRPLTFSFFVASVLFFACTLNRMECETWNYQMDTLFKEYIQPSLVLYQVSPTLWAMMTFYGQILVETAVILLALSHLPSDFVMFLVPSLVLGTALCSSAIGSTPPPLDLLDPIGLCLIIIVLFENFTNTDSQEEEEEEEEEKTEKDCTSTTASTSSNSTIVRFKIRNYILFMRKFQSVGLMKLDRQIFNGVSKRLKTFYNNKHVKYAKVFDEILVYLPFSLEHNNMNLTKLSAFLSASVSCELGRRQRCKTPLYIDAIEIFEEDFEGHGGQFVNEWFLNCACRFKTDYVRIFEKKLNPQTFARYEDKVQSNFVFLVSSKREMPLFFPQHRFKYFYPLFMNYI